MVRASILIQLDPAVLTGPAALADARQQPVSDVAAEVIASYLAPDDWEHRHIRAGLDELQAAKGISHEHVVEWLDSWGTENEMSAPE